MNIVAFLFAAVVLANTEVPFVKAFAMFVMIWAFTNDD